MTLKDAIDATKLESAERQRKDSLDFVRRKVEKMGPTRGFLRALRSQSFSIIAEIKRRSPSMGPIANFNIGAAVEIYRDHPAVSAISVLTQNSHFGGSPDDLKLVRRDTQGRGKAVLRKDFVFSEYEVYYSRWIGADAILLMANVVTDKEQFRTLHDLALSLGLDVLCEIHSREEIDLLPSSVRICGINSRRFKGAEQKVSSTHSVLRALTGKKHDTTTDLGTFALYDALSARLPKDCVRVAESGISASNIQDVLKKYPFRAALIGTSVLKSRAGMAEQLSEISQKAALALADSEEVSPSQAPVFAR